MRTTLTLDDDVAARLERVQAELGLSFKETVNRLLRLSLYQHENQASPRPLYQTRPVDGGAVLADVTRIAELVALDDEATWAQRDR